MTGYTDLIGVTELRSLLTSSNCRVVDCRFHLLEPDKGKAEYLEGHIPRASYAHLDHDLAGPVTSRSGRHPLPDVDRFVDCLQRWGIDNHTQVVAYDHANGAVAARLWWLLRWLGHEKVAVLDGGLAAWIEAGGDVTEEVVDVADVTFNAAPDSRKIATTEEIAAAVISGQAVGLIDARDSARFAGAAEPIDTVAGHIPGAVNLPFTRCTNADGSWLGKAGLRAIWDETVPGGLEAPLVAMCGSGVTACHLLISARLAGRQEPRLYVGSWSEWIRDPQRPRVPG